MLPRRAPRRAVRPLAVLALSALALVAGVRGTQDAVANGDTRTLSLVHQHTKEEASVTFRRNGQYDAKALEQLNWMLRDWRRDEQTRMDPRLFDIVWEVQRSLGSQAPIEVMSAYRSPETNSMLRRRSRGVAKHSQHMEGKAMDFHLPDVPMERVRAIAMRLQKGGVGFYPNAYTPFVHLDAGSVRSWPRMSRDQLARLFPDGRTVHIPKDGKPMEGYEVAKAEIIARGGSVAGYAAYASADEETTQPRRKSLWATLFGGGDDDEDTDYIAATQPRGRAAAPPVRTASAYAPMPSGGDGVDMMAAFRSAEPARARAASVPPAPRPEPERPAQPIQVASAEEPALPRFGWQTAPAGQPAAPGQISQGQVAQGQVASEPRVADVPTPPRRPEDLAPPGVLVAVPAPPVRPVALAFASAEASSFALPRAGDAAPPAVSPAALAPVAHPAPPARPFAVAALVRPAERVEAVPARAPERPATDDERMALRALFAAAATPGPAADAPRVAAARTRTRPDAPAGFVADASPNLALGFSDDSADLPPARFTGPAVKALPVRR
jgi:uncharacterized protein YcbK (DUF882 family)